MEPYSEPPPFHETLPLPGATVLARLALSDTGFAFDPVSGDSFTLNQTGLALLRIFLRHRNIAEVLEEVERDFDVDPLEAERDIHDFAVQISGSLKP
ncbi:MAG: PqqD family protein [Geothrix sp.]|nr:PqqD family protein [Geothrix sp.]